MKNLKLCMLTALLFTYLFGTSQEVFDSSFGGNGTVNIGEVDISDVQFQGEDKIVGMSQDLWDQKVILYRLNLGGSLDYTFGDNGSFESYGHEDGSWNLVLDSEENIYFASSNTDTIKITKVTQNGTLDESFGNNGHAELLTSSVSEQVYVNRLAIDNNGKLIASGIYEDIETGTSRIIVARFNQDGSTDTSFGTNGIYLNPEIPNENQQKNTGKTIINPDNSIVVSGYVSYLDNLAGMLVVKIKPDGTIDETFADGGMYSPIIGEFSDIWGGFIMDDNSIILYGGQSNTSEYKGMVTKLSSNGELDTSFGNNGYGGCYNGGPDVAVNYYDAILKNNEIILVGDILDLTTSIHRALFTKLGIDGTIDDNYGENGSMFFSSESENSGLRAFAFVEKDDEYYCAGTSSYMIYFTFGAFFKLKNLDTHANLIDKIDFAIYPNPASDFIHINSNNLIEQFSVYNMMGQKIHGETRIANEYKINTFQFKKGAYLVKAKINGNYTSKKILIE